MTKKDNWNTEDYGNAASFVPALTNTVVKYLDPQPDDIILDVGCGDGILSANIAPRCKKLVGLDSSASMIQTSNDKVRSQHPNTSFYQKDCRRVLPSTAEGANVDDNLLQVLQHGSYDKIFSNAAMHWILAAAQPRQAYFDDVATLLKPDGVFVFEMGGAGNVAEVHTAYLSVLSLRYGVPLEKLEQNGPWFFPSEKWMRETLNKAGLEVEKLELEYRPTQLTAKTESGSGGLEGWVKLMGANYFDLLENQNDRDSAVRDVCNVVKTVVGRVEDNSEWLGYVRLRGVARKKR